MNKLPDNIKVSKLMIENYCPDLLLESSHNAESNEWFVEGIFAQGDVKNNNGRVYPVKLLDESMQDYISTKVDTKRAYGELGHPSSPKINLDLVCILVDKLEKKDANWMGHARVMHEDCPNGKILRGILKSGGSVGVSTRGLGAAENTRYGNEDCDLVNEFIMRAIDVVADPSAPDAYVNAIHEEKQYILDDSNEVVCELNEETYKIFEEKLRNMPRRVRTCNKEQTEYLYEGLVTFLSGLRKNPKK